ncbi:MAG: hypothetical protein JNM02_11360, partial [Anaerolineales bacterium]|nr:hypothetical protein [Anaerolineales bacterium]
TPKNAFFLNFFARMYQILVPENLSLYPKRRSYTTQAKFRDHGLFDMRGEFGWEEYFWKERPFAMHMKGGTRKYEDIGYEKLQNILSQLVSTSTQIPQ